jgi:hypothetical protein
MSLPFVTRAYFVFKIILGWSEIPLYRELMTEENIEKSLEGSIGVLYGSS